MFMKSHCSLMKPWEPTPSTNSSVCGLSYISPCFWTFFCSKTVWLEPCSCIQWTGRCHSPLKDTLLALHSSRWRATPKSQLCSALLCEDRQEEKYELELKHIQTFPETLYVWLILTISAAHHWSRDATNREPTISKESCGCFLPPRSTEWLPGGHAGNNSSSTMVIVSRWLLGEAALSRFLSWFV